jgi:hypothetical protein
MEFINLVVFKHACDKRGKRKKKSHTRQIGDNYSMLTTYTWRGRRDASIIVPKLDFDHRTTSYTPSKACNHRSHISSFFFKLFYLAIDPITPNETWKLQNNQI